MINRIRSPEFRKWVFPILAIVLLISGFLWNRGVTAQAEQSHRFSFAGRTDPASNSSFDQESLKYIDVTYTSDGGFGTSEVTCVYDQFKSRYCYMSYATARTANTYYYTKWLTITKDKVDKNSMQWIDNSYWVDPTRLIDDERGENGLLYTLFSINKSDVDSILKKRCGMDLDALASASNSSSVTVYVQPSFYFQIAGVGVDGGDSGRGYYTYNSAWARASALGFAAGTYFNEFNVPITLPVPKKVDVYMQAYYRSSTSGAAKKYSGLGQKTAVSNVEGQIKYSIKAGGAYSLTNSGTTVTANMPKSVTISGRKYLLRDIQIANPSSANYASTFNLSNTAGYSKQKNMASMTNAMLEDFNNDDKTDYNGVIAAVNGSSYSLARAQSTGKTVIRVVYQATPQYSLTTKYYLATSSSGGITKPTTPVKTDNSVMSLYYGDPLTVKTASSESTSGTTFKVGTSATIKGTNGYLYNVVLKKGSKVLKSWQTGNGVDSVILGAAGNTDDYNTLIDALKNADFYTQDVSGNYTLELYYAPRITPKVTVVADYYDETGKTRVKTATITTATPSLGSLYRLSSASGLSYNSNSYYYWGASVSYYTRKGLTFSAASYTEPAPSPWNYDSRNTTIKSAFSTFKASGSWEAWGNITVRIKYRCFNDPTTTPKTVTYTVKHHYMKRNPNKTYTEISGSPVTKFSKTYNYGEKVTTKAAETVSYGGKDYTFYDGTISGALSAGKGQARTNYHGKSITLTKNTTVELWYYYEDPVIPNAYSVYIHYVDKNGNEISGTLTNPDGNTRREKGETNFNLSGFKNPYMYKTLANSADSTRPWNLVNGYYTVNNGKSATWTKSDITSSSHVVQNVQTDVHVYLIYTQKIPVIVRYVLKNATNYTLDSTAPLDKIKEPGWSGTLGSYAGADTAFKNDYTAVINGKKYAYIGEARLENFASGNLGDTAITLANLKLRTVTLPNSISGGTPAITLKYGERIPLTVEYYLVDENESAVCMLKSPTIFKSAFTRYKASQPIGHTNSGATYPSKITIAGTSNKATYIGKASILFDDNNGNPQYATIGSTRYNKAAVTLANLPNINATPTGAVTVRLYYRWSHDVTLSVQRVSAVNGALIDKSSTVVKDYKKGTLAYLSDASSFFLDPLTNVADKYEGWVYSQHCVLSNLNGTSAVNRNGTFAAVGATNVTMTQDKLLKIYYTPKYNFTINYVALDGSSKIIVKEPVQFKVLHGTMISGPDYSAYLPETINGTYNYCGQYQWHSDTATRKCAYTSLASTLLYGPVTSDVTLTIYYKQLPDTVLTVYRVDRRALATDPSNAIIGVSQDVQLYYSKSVISQLVAGTDAANFIASNANTLDLTSEGLRNYRYAKMYKLVANTTQPPTTGLAGSNTVQELGNLSITDPTKNYSLFIYYDPILTVTISYVNAETLETVGTLAVPGIYYGDTASFPSNSVTDTYTLKDANGTGVTGYLMGYTRILEDGVDPNSPPESYTAAANSQTVINSGTLALSPATVDACLYLYYRIPSKMTIHYVYNGEELTNLQTTVPMVPIKNFTVPAQYVKDKVNNGVHDGLLVAWEMNGVKLVGRKLVSSPSAVLSDPDLVIQDAYDDEDLYLYYRYLTTPGTDGQESTTETVNDSDILDDAGNVEFGTYGSIYDDSSDDVVDGYTQAKTYNVSALAEGIAGGDLAESSVVSLKYGYSIGYTTYRSTRNFGVLIVDEIGATLDEFSVDRDYVINKLNKFTILKANNYSFKNLAIDGTNNTVNGDYGTHVDNVLVTYKKLAAIAKMASLPNDKATIAAAFASMGYTVNDVLEWKVNTVSEMNPLTGTASSINDALVVSMNTIGKTEEKYFDFKSSAESLVQDYAYDSDTLLFTNPFSAATIKVLDKDSSGDGISSDVVLSAAATNGAEYINSITTHLPISKTVSNAEYKTTDCSVSYTDGMTFQQGSDTPTAAFTDAQKKGTYDMNGIVVHTPVRLSLSVNSTGLVCQSVNGISDSTPMASLGREVVVSYSMTGNHKEAMGYKYRDYSEYSTGKVYLAFPVEVLYNGVYYAADQLIEVGYDAGNTDNNAIAVTIPTWAKTGDFVVKGFVYATNALTDDQKQHVNPVMNSTLAYYAASASAPIRIIGNVYGFEVYDISDYPLWQSVFRQDNSLKFKTGVDQIRYTVGQRNWMSESNNQSSQFTLPLMDGSHPTNKGEGTLGTGYVFRYRLQTTGSMYDDNDSISITPRFYYVSKDGTVRQEVDLYYNGDTNEGRASLVKVGSTLDQQSTKSIKVGDEYLGIPDEELENTAKLLNTTVQELKGKTVESYTFSSITLPSSLRTFVGGSTVPAGAHASAATIQKSVQEWYGEYYLPSKLYACAKGFDVKNYADSNGINFSEEFWLKDGYVVVNFTIETINNGEKELSYNPGLPGTVNMWKQEGMVLTKSDSHGATFDLSYGDVVFYNRAKAAEDDYLSSGTH